MPLWLSMAAIVTVLIFVTLRKYLPAMISLELKSEQIKKVKERGHVVQPQDVPDRKSRDHTVKDNKMPLWSDKMLPKHKRDPRIFVDGKEIGDEPYS